MSAERMFAIYPTVEDGEAVARVALVLNVNTMMKSGKIGYRDMIDALLCVTGTTVAMFAAQDKAIVSDNMTAALEASIRRAMEDKELQKLHADIAARSVQH